MTMRSAGVALAAVMACGWASGAQAAPFTIDFTIGASTIGVTGNAPYGITPADFPASGSATLEYTSYNDVRLDSFSLTLGVKQFTTADIDSIVDIFDNPSDNRTPTGFLLTSSRGNFNGYPGARNFTLTLLEDPNTNLSQFFVSPLDNSQENGIGCFKCVTSTVVSGTISPVPLPASAPLFGAALLGLAAVGYGMKRHSRIASA